MLDEPRYPDVDPNKKSAKELWDGRYEGDAYLYGKQPSAFVKHYGQSLKKGKLLDVAMGEGRNAVFLAQQGFDVSGVDASPKAIEKAKKLAEENGAKIDAKVQNLDFFLMPLMKFQSVVMTFFRPQTRFFSEIRRGLVQGGTVLIEGYTTEHLKNQKQPNDLIDFEDCYKPNEVLRLLKDFQILYYKEMPEGDSHLVQAIALKANK